MIGGVVQKGFTIVELLIVIVVIGILAAITIVAFNGVQTRARDAAITQSIAQYARAFQVYAGEHNTYVHNGGSDVIVCIDGRSDCWSSVDAAETTRVSQALRTIMGSLPAVPARHALNFTAARNFYIAFEMSSASSTCPVISGTRDLGSFTSSGLQACRVGLPLL